MDRAAVISELERVERHISECSVQVAKQIRLAQQLERDGQRAEPARRVLQSLEKSLFTYEEDRSRLLRELERMKGQA